MLLTDHPVLYLHPELTEHISLARLTKIYQWLDPTLDESQVFDLHRDQFITLRQDTKQWLKALPSAILDRTELEGGWFGPGQKAIQEEALKRLPQALASMESMVETCHRFESYQVEIQAFSQTNLSFQAWQKLAPKEARPEGAILMYLLPSEPVTVMSETAGES